MKAIVKKMTTASPYNPANTADIAGGAASNNISAPQWMAPAI
jgi:hypothetical protein